MRTAPQGWNEIRNTPHSMEYLFDIGGVAYTADDIQGTPVIDRPLMNEPSIGRCCTGMLTLTVREKSNIPRAAPIVAYCRLRERGAAGAATPWMELGHYWVSRRKGTGGLVTLTCRDAMMSAGQTYADKTQYTEWPVAMDAVLDEIAALMGVTLDSRTVIKTGGDFVINYPNEDVLMSEVLGVIAAAHGGIFIMSEVGQLRLVSFPDTTSPVYAMGSGYNKYVPLSTGMQVTTRITLADSAGNQFTSGDDTGIELAAECESATQEMVDGLSSELYGCAFTPYALQGAYIDPCMELGDTFSIARKDETLLLIAGSIKIRCNSSFACDLQNGIADDDEDEYPFIRAADLQAKRYVSTTKSYFGNRLDRKNGLTSELVVDGEAVARLVANAGIFSMQRNVNGVWEDCIYFDVAAHEYRLKVSGFSKTYVSESEPIGTFYVGDMWVQRLEPSTWQQLAAMCWDELFEYTWDELSNGRDILHVWDGNAWQLVYDANQITRNTTAIEQNAEQIALKASSETVNALGNRVSAAETSITQNAQQISLRATKTSVDALTGRVDTAESAITQTAQQINLKVSKNSVISEINQSAEAISIRANKIDFTSDGVKFYDTHGTLVFEVGFDPGQGSFVSSDLSKRLHLMGRDFYFFNTATNGPVILGRDEDIGYVQQCFYPVTTRTGNLGTPAHIWDTASIRVVFRESEGGLSSRKIKRKIRKLKNVSKIIDALTPVTFVYKDDPGGKEHYGLVYEDTEPVAPLLCVQLKDGDTNPRNLGVDYSSMGVLLLKEIQEMRARVAALEKQNTELRGRMAALESEKGGQVNAG